MSSYFATEDDIAEEPEEDGADPKVIERTRKRLESITLESAVADLVPEEEVLLKSCLEEIHDVVGDSVPDSVIISQILRFKFNMEKALDAVLTGGVAINPEGNILILKYSKIGLTRAFTTRTMLRTYYRIRYRHYITILNTPCM
jgi:hypothetical protein